LIQWPTKALEPEKYGGVMSTLSDVSLLQYKTKFEELEDIMAMLAHKFRGALQRIQYNAEHENQKQTTLQSVQTMTGLLNIFDMISTNAQTLREKLRQDTNGDGTLLIVLEKSLSTVLTQILSIGNIDKISQHYLAYAKKTGQVPAKTTRKQWRKDYIDLREKLQTEWEENFMALSTEPSLTKIIPWIEARFFNIEIVGFYDNPIRFKRYGATESVLVIVMTEIFLNAIKYYSSEIHEPVKLRWLYQPDVCRFICENPTSEREREIDKGHYKGHAFLNLIANKLDGHFYSVVQDSYKTEFSVPTYLLMNAYHFATAYINRTLERPFQLQGLLFSRDKSKH
jgi:hypothetical protein